MEPKTLKALKASIKKWERNVKIRLPENARVSADSCPLCRIFWDEGCDRCPIALQAGAVGCFNTPYKGASEALEIWDFNRDVESKKAWQAAAAAHSINCHDELVEALEGVVLDPWFAHLSDETSDRICAILTKAKGE